MSEKDILSALNEKVYKAQQENRALRYRILTTSTLPTIREHLLLAGISGDDLARYDSFISEAMDICGKYMKGEEE